VTAKLATTDPHTAPASQISLRGSISHSFRAAPSSMRVALTGMAGQASIAAGDRLGIVTRNRCHGVNLTFVNRLRDGIFHRNDATQGNQDRNLYQHEHYDSPHVLQASRTFGGRAAQVTGSTLGRQQPWAAAKATPARAASSGPRPRAARP
jgi:hypothetical protein